MGRLLISAAVAAATIVSGASAQVGEKPPELDAVKWYNTPPLALGDLEGKAVLVEVFRTW